MLNRMIKIQWGRNIRIGWLILILGHNSTSITVNLYFKKNNLQIGLIENLLKLDSNMIMSANLKNKSKISKRKETQLIRIWRWSLVKLLINRRMHSELWLRKMRMASSMRKISTLLNKASWRNWLALNNSATNILQLEMIWHIFQPIVFQPVLSLKLYPSVRRKGKNADKLEILTIVEVNWEAVY